VLILLSAAIAGSSVLGCSGGQGSAGDKEITREIPLREIYCTSTQEGLKRLTRAFSLAEDGSKNYVEAYGRYLGEIHSQYRAGGPNIALVRGKDLNAAVRATWLALLGSRSLTRPVLPDDGSKNSQFWLVVHLGTGSSTPPAWLIKSVRQDGRAFRVIFTEPKRRNSTDDIEHYL